MSTIIREIKLTEGNMTSHKLITRKILLSDIKYFDKNERSSHLSFSTVFLWGSVYGYNCTEINSALFVYYRYGGNYYSFPPFGEYGREETELFREHLGEDFSFSPVPEGDVYDALSEFCTSFTEMRDNFDYIYKTEDLISLPGSRYHAKRNHIAKFLSLYGNDFEYVKITEENLDILKSAADRLYLLDPSLDKEKKAIDLAIEHFSFLSLRAGVIVCKDIPIAYTIGEKIGDEALIHFEKGDRAFEGVYPFICREFVKREFSDTLFVNREEDMGIEGLRKSKLSYHPDHFIKAFIAYPE